MFEFDEQTESDLSSSFEQGQRLTPYSSDPLQPDYRVYLGDGVWVTDIPNGFEITAVGWDSTQLDKMREIILIKSPAYFTCAICGYHDKKRFFAFLADAGNGFQFLLLCDPLVSLFSK